MVCWSLLELTTASVIGMHLPSRTILLSEEAFWLARGGPGGRGKRDQPQVPDFLMGARRAEFERPECGGPFQAGSDSVPERIPCPLQWLRIPGGCSPAAAEVEAAAIQCQAHAHIDARLRLPDVHPPTYVDPLPRNGIPGAWACGNSPAKWSLASAPHDSRNCRPGGDRTRTQGRARPRRVGVLRGR